MTARPGEVLIAASDIAARVRALAGDVASDLEKDLAGEGAALETEGRVALVPVLTGAIVFCADLIRHLPLAMSMEMVSVSSYPGRTTRSQGVTLRGETPGGLAGKHVLIVDDILDSGRTLARLKSDILEQGPASLRICVLLRKSRRRESPVEADYVGFDIPDVFVIGYGLDYDGHYRNLPDIRALEGLDPEA